MEREKRIIPEVLEDLKRFGSRDLESRITTYNLLGNLDKAKFCSSFTFIVYPAKKPSTIAENNENISEEVDLVLLADPSKLASNLDKALSFSSLALESFPVEGKLEESSFDFARTNRIPLAVLYLGHDDLTGEEIVGFKVLSTLDEQYTFDAIMDRCVQEKEFNQRLEQRLN